MSTLQSEIRYPSARTVTETEDEIIIEGHNGVFECEEVRYPKREYTCHVPLHNRWHQAEIIITYKGAG